MQRALVLAAICSGIPLACSSCIGLLLSLVQAATQVQEQSLQFLAKLAVVSVLLFCGWNWALQEMSMLVQNTFLGIAALGRL